MAAGSRTTYALDLNDIITFPDLAHTPVFPPAPGESWIILTEIIRDESLMRPVFRVREKLGSELVVAFYTDSPKEDARNCQVGHILCIKGARPKRFLDGQLGYRIEDKEAVDVIPCSMNKLRELNQMLRDRSSSGRLRLCLVCDNETRVGCTRCKTRYCSKECQTADWQKHKGECKAMKDLHKWNRTDWG